MNRGMAWVPRENEWLWNAEIFRRIPSCCQISRDGIQEKTISHKTIPFHVLTHRVLLPFLLRVVGFPPACRKDVLVAFIPSSQNHLPCMRLDGKEGGAFLRVQLFIQCSVGQWYLVLFHSSIINQPDILVYVKTKQRP